VFEKKAKKLNPSSLKKGEVVWSEYFRTYVKFVQKEEDGDLIFKFMFKKGYCVINSDSIFEPAPLIKELL
jgi:hypothetical protein